MDSSWKPNVGQANQGATQSPGHQPASKHVSPATAANPDNRAKIWAPISLPKGGGAIKSIGDTFEVNENTGTGALTVPIALSESRGQSPNLSLKYSPGFGNSPFGLGWMLSQSTVSRKTDKGLPRYHDSDDNEADVFVLDGEDLVPLYHKDNDGEASLAHNERQYVDTTTQTGYAVRKYMHRVERDFPRIERWTDLANPSQIHWRKIDKENTTFIYGLDSDSRIEDSSDGDPQKTRIFSWLLSESYDVKGIATVYRYKQENIDGIALNAPSERNRRRYRNRYLKAIQYGNRQPNRDPTSWEPFSASKLPDSTWMFTVVFDYGEHSPDHPVPSESSSWLCRRDPFSSYRSTFEIRTYRLCQRILMFHHFPEQLGETDVLVSAMKFTYDENPSATYLTSIAQLGYLCDSPGQYQSKSLPPLDLTYALFPTDEQLARLVPRAFDPQTLGNVPSGDDGSDFQWIDLDGEGLSGILSQTTGGTFYKRNLSIQPDEDGQPRAPKFGNLESLHTTPAVKHGETVLMDLAADGHVDVVKMGLGICGFYARIHDDWAPFRSFQSFPNIDFKDPYLRFVDLTGDGLADIMISGDQVITWYQSAGYKGFLKASNTPNPLSETAGPRVVFTDLNEKIYFADMTGDGLSDVVRIRNGSVQYWPNLGYGRFGKIVTMSNPPFFDAMSSFDHRYVLLADVDGSGTTDILYLKSRSVAMYLNQSGNSFADVKHLRVSFPMDSLSNVTALDLFGNGTTCLVWSSPVPGSFPSMKYVDITGGTKPHLMTKRVNNIGSEWRIHYAPSTKFYLRDKLLGTPWVTRLAFPVQCVEKVEVFEHITRSRLVSRYAYHHGYFDGSEREFRGFGMVERWDTEDFGATSLAEASTIVPGAAMRNTPIYTKTWYHTGTILDYRQISQFLQQSYFGADDASKTYHGALLSASVLPDNLTVSGINEACRALSSCRIREEKYGLDGSPLETTPFTVTENSYQIVAVQPLADNHDHSIFTVQPRETMSCNFERNPEDPRVQHTMTIEVDSHGNVLKSLEIAYGREAGNSTLDPSARVIQETSLILYHQNLFTNSIDTANDYCLPAPASSTQFQIYGYSQSKRLQYMEFTPQYLESLTSIPYEGSDNIKTAGKRVVQASCIKYRPNSLDLVSDLLDIGVLESMRVPGQTYQLAFTPGLIGSLEGLDGDMKTSDLISNLENTLGGTGASQGGYVSLKDGNWWKPSNRTFYDPSSSTTDELVSARNHFFQPMRTTDPFGNTSNTTYDNSALLPVQFQDAVGDVTIASNNYVVLQPNIITDPNGNRQEVVFDELARVVGTAVEGKTTENLGDSLDAFKTVLSDEDTDAFYANPQTLATAILGNATTRTVYDFRLKNGMPRYTASISRQHHVSDQRGDGHVYISFTYYDGLGRTVQMKHQAESGPVTEGGPEVADRWVGSGWTIYNNKGKPVKQFEPFFDGTHQFKSDQTVGVSSILLYDAIDRSVVKIFPNHTWTKTIIQAWQQQEYDQNDNVLENDPTQDEHVGGLFALLPLSDYGPTWSSARIHGGLGKDEQAAASKTAAHSNTPSISNFDTMGRTIILVETYSPTQQFNTIVEFDILGRNLSVTDANHRIVEQVHYDLLRNPIYTASMEAGQRWSLLDSTDQPIFVWESGMQRFRMTYDQLRRPANRFLLSGVSSSEVMIELNVWGSMALNGKERNQCGKLVETRDQSGVRTNTLYDFKGNLVQTQRQLALEYKATVDWSKAVDLDTQVYSRTVAFDALNRTTLVTTPDKSLIQYDYNTRNLVSQILCNLRSEQDSGKPRWTPFVSDLTHNAKSQRTAVQYGNDTATFSTYDPLTFRLSQTITRRASDTVQQLTYVYDPVGNITHLQDDAQQTIYFRNEVVTPSNDYTYDPFYRLIEASGREQLGQLDGNSVPLPGESTRVTHPDDRNAMARYLESYSYDPVGNILSLRHQGADPVNPGWTRRYSYKEPSQLEPSQISNRLSSTTIGNIEESYSYEGAAGLRGNLTSIPQLSMVRWNFANQISATSKQVISDGGTPETTYYVYDSQGIRVRKVTERAAPASSSASPARRKERIYLDDYEVFREFATNGTEVTLERQTVHISDDQQRLALVEYRSIGTETKTPQQLIRYQCSNSVGSVTLELDQSGKVVSYEEYTPFGESSYQAASSQTEVPKRYRYIGKERDEESGLYYVAARYYMPAVGRWTSCDPIGLGDESNLYVYVGNNPINWTDPSGKCPWKEGFSESFIQDEESGNSNETETQFFNGETTLSSIRGDEGESREDDGTLNELVQAFGDDVGAAVEVEPTSSHHVSYDEQTLNQVFDELNFNVNVNTDPEAVLHELKILVNVNPDIEAVLDELNFNAKVNPDIEAVLHELKVLVHVEPDIEAVLEHAGPNPITVHPAPVKGNDGTVDEFNYMLAFKGEWCNKPRK